MKIRNKILIGALSAAMLFGSVLTVFAADVPSVNAQTQNYDQVDTDTKAAADTSGTASSGAAKSVTTTTVSNASPKTGVATNWAGYAMAAVALTAGAATFTRKRRA